MIDVSIIIANYNTASFLRDCLRSVHLHTEGLTFEVIVVDDYSSGVYGGMGVIAKEFPQTEIIFNQRNLGYAESNNIGFALATGKYVLLLNPDTLLMDNAIGKLFKFMENHDRVYACGAQLLNRDGSWQVSAGRFPALAQACADAMFLNDIFPRANIPCRAEKKRDCTHKVDYVSGADLFIRRDAAPMLFDSRIFDTYSEDLDFGYRMRDGYAYIVTDAKIVHFGGGSFSGADGVKKRLKLINSGYHRFLVKHHGHLYSLIWRTLMAWHYSVKTAFYLVKQKDRIPFGFNMVKYLLFPKGGR